MKHRKNTLSHFRKDERIRNQLFIKVAVKFNNKNGFEPLIDMDFEKPMDKEFNSVVDMLSNFP